MFQVQWLQAAMGELGTIWQQSSPTHRPAVVWAIGDLDYRLSRDPANEGESRPGGARITFSWPLGILFTYDEDARRVEIRHTWDYS